MNPTDHVLVAILPIAAYCLLRHRRLPTSGVILVALFAGVFPDLVDKPLAWTFGVVPSGRMVAHSLVFAVPVIAGVVFVSYRRDRLAHGLAFGWGYVSHIVGDFFRVITEGASYYYYPNLFWPLMAANPDRNPGFGNEIFVVDLELFVELAVIAFFLGYAAFDLRRRTRRPRRG